MMLKLYWASVPLTGVLIPCLVLACHHPTPPSFPSVIWIFFPPFLDNGWSCNVKRSQCYHWFKYDLPFRILHGYLLWAARSFWILLSGERMPRFANSSVLRALSYQHLGYNYTNNSYLRLHPLLLQSYLKSSQLPFIPDMFLLVEMKNF